MIQTSFVQTTSADLDKLVNERLRYLYKSAEDVGRTFNLVDIKHSVAAYAYSYSSVTIYTALIIYNII